MKELTGESTSPKSDIAAAIYLKHRSISLGKDMKELTGADKFKTLSDLFESVEPWKNVSKYIEIFPHGIAGSISNYCLHNNPYASFSVKPTAALIEHVKEHCVVADAGPFYFEIINRGDELLVIWKYNSIIGGRWITVLPTDTVLPFEKEEDDDEPS